jgi:hypothetical protein
VIRLIFVKYQQITGKSKTKCNGWASRHTKEMNFLNDITENWIAWVKSKTLVLLTSCFDKIQHDQGKTLIQLSSTVTSDTELVVNGVLMRQQMEISEFRSEDGKSRVIHVHRRSIDDRFIDSYKVVDSSDEETFKISTPMSKSEIGEFESTWTKKWNP